MNVKKFKKLLLVLSVLALLPLGVSAKDKVNVYLFKKEGCPRCAEALEFFNGLDEEYKSYFNLVIKDVSKTDTNALLKKVVNHFKVNMKGVPFMVIGNQTYEGFKVGETEEQLKTAIKTNYENETRDVVASLMVNKKKNSSSIIWILLAIIVGIGFLMVMAKDNKKEVAPKKKATSKKNSKK